MTVGDVRLTDLVQTGLLFDAVCWTVACGTSGPVGPVVHEHHTVERGGATSARVEIGMTAGDLE